jgi:hypothetical protein
MSRLRMVGMLGLGRTGGIGAVLGAGVVAVLGVSKIMFMLAPKSVSFMFMISLAMVISRANSLLKIMFFYGKSYYYSSYLTYFRLLLVTSMKA